MKKRTGTAGPFSCLSECDLLHEFQLPAVIQLHEIRGPHLAGALVKVLEPRFLEHSVHKLGTEDDVGL